MVFVDIIRDAGMWLGRRRRTLGSFESVLESLNREQCRHRQSALVLREEATEFCGATDGKGRSDNMAKQANDNAGRGAFSATQKRTQRKYKAMARARGEVWEEG